MSTTEHWERVYQKNAPHAVGWYTPHLQISLQWIQEVCPDTSAAIIDAGGGACTLVDDLLHRHYTHLTVLDISPTAIQLAQKRLGEQAQQVTWLKGDILTYPFSPEAYNLWHDRAVFHFLQDGKQKAQYIGQAVRALKPGGYLLLAVFSPEAPPKCSGLPVSRYTTDDLEKLMEKQFRLLRHQKHLHITPSGVAQQYVYCLFQKQ